MSNEPRLFRIKELERLTGISRRTILFYVEAGLLHPPVKTGKTMAYYDEAHRRKLAYIRKAKAQGLPLIAIRQMIEKKEKQAKAFGPRIAKDFVLEKRLQYRGKLPRKAQGKNTRERILEGGSEIFRQKGYNNTTVSDITYHLGIGKGSFYSYFSNKKELFLECVPLIFEEFFSTGWEQIRKEKDPYRRLLLRAQISMPVSKEFSIILQLSKEALHDGDPKLKKLGEQIFLSVTKPIESDIEEGIKQGIFRPIDPKIVSNLLIGIIESLDYLLAANPKLPVDSFKDALLDLFASGLIKTNGSTIIKNQVKQ